MNTVAEIKLYSVCNLVAMATHSATGQKRRGTDKPYYIHPFSVSEKLKEKNYPTKTIVAGLLHDVVEDTEISLEDLRFMLFSFDSYDADYTRLIDETLVIVELVTDRYTPKFIKANRKDRIMLEGSRLLSSLNPDAWVVKLADSLDNMKDVSGIDTTFLKIWLSEKDVFFSNLPKGRYYADLHQEVIARLDALNDEFHFRDRDLWQRQQDAMEYFLTGTNREDFENAYRIDSTTC